MSNHKDVIPTSTKAFKRSTLKNPKAAFHRLKNSDKKKILQNIINEEFYKPCCKSSFVILFPFHFLHYIYFKTQ